MSKKQLLSSIKSTSETMERLFRNISHDLIPDIKDDPKTSYNTDPKGV